MQVWTHFQVQIYPRSLILSKWVRWKLSDKYISVNPKYCGLQDMSLLHFCLPVYILPHLKKIKTEL